MFATVRRYSGVVDPEKAAARVREGFVPLIKGIDGFVAYFWIDAGGGLMFSTSVFESQKAAEESNRKAAEWVKENLADLLPNRPEITSGTVVATSVEEEFSPATENMAPSRENMAPADIH